MNAIFAVEKPKAIQFTLQVTMPLSEWLELKEQLSVKWPSARLSTIIEEMTYKAEEVFCSKPE